jgi:succinyl-diaminopimelate desuccinylase
MSGLSAQVEQALLDGVGREWIAEKALRLAEIPSVTMNEAQVCLYFEAQLRELGLDVDIREVTPGRSNLYARIPGKGGGPSLLLNGHLDTIPIGSCTDVYRESDRLYGRGTTDMKGGMAAMLGAARSVLRSGFQLSGDLWLSAVVGHEEVEADKDGPRALVEDLKMGRLHADRILIVEGRDALWVMSMGSMVFRITLDSALGGMHTQYVPFAENPIRFVGDIIDCVHDLQKRLDKLPPHPLAGAERVDIGELHAGDYFNRTPVRCEISGTRRWAPGKTSDGILAELDALLRPISESGKLSMTVTMAHEREPFETQADDPAVQAVAGAHRSVVGSEAECIGMRIVGDANIYVHGSGVPTFYYGPSNETAHADIEWVSIDRMASAAGVYALAAAQYCGISDP